MCHAQLRDGAAARPVRDELLACARAHAYPGAEEARATREVLPEAERRDVAGVVGMFTAITRMVDMTGHCFPERGESASL